MKRHESIVALSREHHFGLLFCWKIRQGLKKGIAPDRMKSYVSYFWESNLRQHFEEEETILFSEVKDELSNQAIAEHKEIEALIIAVKNAKSITGEELARLAEAVDKHIRFEERVLFPHIEEALSEAELEAVNRRLKAYHQAPAKDDFQDEFWL